MTKTQEYLENLDACREARKWVGDRTLQEAWNVCNRLDWMKWLLDAPIRAEYEAKRNSIWAECEAKHDLIRAEYEAKWAPIWAEYKAKWAPIWACETCDEVRAKFSCPGVAA